MATRTRTGWTSSTFDRGVHSIQWRIDGDRVQLRHGGHADQGTLTVSLAEWQSFVAAAQSGQAGAVAY